MKLLLTMIRPNFGAEGACEPYDNTCNEDCNAGPFGGTWDAITCACVDEITPVNGCADEAATNFDPEANCDDDSCTYLTCEDPCAPNFGAEGACEPYNNTCNEDCLAGPFGGTWDTATCSCIDEITPVYGCTDETAPNFDPEANCDDGSCGGGGGLCEDPCATNFGELGPCEPYNTTCNDDCTMGPFGGTWDAATCSCIYEVEPISGCTGENACNYDPSANCDDDNCDYGNVACVDPCNEPNLDDNCDITTDSFDAVTCTVTNEPNCPANTIFNANMCRCDEDIIMGCTDPCAPNFNPMANMDNGTCARYNNSCNEDCTVGPFGGTWDATTCSCINEVEPINGCIDENACNYDASANCNDDSCNYGNTACIDPCNEPDPDDNCDITTDSYDATTCTVTNEPNCPDGEFFAETTCECLPDTGCTDPCSSNYNPQANVDDGSCLPYNTDCNEDCTQGPYGGTWDPDACSCINEIIPANGCTDVNACNYNAAANCDDGSCNYGNVVCADPCNEPDPDDGCDITTDSIDAVTCEIINEPNCLPGTIFNTETCNCDTDEECVPPNPGTIECDE